MSTPKRPRWPALVAFLVTAIVFAPIVGNGLLAWDDQANLVDNPAYQGLGWDQFAWAFTTTHLGPYQPLSWLSYSLDHTLWGGDPTGFYVTNLLLHAVSAALLALCALELLPRAIPRLAAAPRVLAVTALAATVFWSCHPLRAESVAWATERRDVLSTALLLGSLLAWLRHTDGRTDATGWWRSRAYHAALLLFAASLLAKATAMAWPMALLLLDRAPLGRSGWRGLVAEKAPFFGVSALAAGAAWLGQSDNAAVVGLDQVGIGGRVGIAGYATAFYPLKMLIPTGLRAHYARPHPFDPGDPMLWAGVAATLLVTGAALALRTRKPLLMTVWGAYLLLLAPVSGLTLTGFHLVAERYSHQASIPLALGAMGAVAAFALSRASVRPRMAVGSTGMVLGVLALVCVAQVRTWRNSETLFTNVVLHEPTNWVALEQLARVASERGDHETAFALLERSLETSPPREKALTHAAHAALELGRMQVAAEWTERALAVKPDYAPAWRVLGRIRSSGGDPDGAEEAYRSSIALDPAIETRQDLAEMLANRGKAAEAEQLIRGVLADDPSRVEARVFLGSLVAARGEHAEAEALFRDALEHDPRSTLALGWLAGSLQARGADEEAEGLYRRLLEVEPDSARALGSLAMLLAKRGENEEAARLSLQAVAAMPRHPGPRLQAAGLLLASGDSEGARRQATRALELASANGDRRSAERAQQLLTRLP